MKKIAVGIAIGVVLSFSASAFASQIKQYILTEVNYPVVVNGVEYKDAKNPILNYQGATYIPLAKIGDLTGVQYKWNAEKKRVEIGPEETSGVLTGATILPGTDYPIVEAPNPYGYKNLVDADDTQLVMAQFYNEKLPPKLSEGWMSEKVFDKASTYSVSYKDKEKTIVVIGKPFAVDPKIREQWTFNLPSDFTKSETGSTTVDGVRMQKYKGFIYFNIEDLESIGVLTK